MKKTVLLFWLCCLNSAFAQLSLFPIFSENMVLQQGVEIPIWGKTKALEKVVMKFNNHTYYTKADQHGNWEVTLPPMPPSDNMNTLLVSTKSEQIILKNIVFGDVWLCSGQSNMDMTVSAANHFEQEKKEANDSFIRCLKIPRMYSEVPQNQVKFVEWKKTDSLEVGNFTAVGYYFAKNIRESQKNIPIGLIQSSWGGTRLECWMSRKAMKFKQQADVEQYHENMKAYKLSEVEKYNGKIIQEDTALTEKEWIKTDFNDDDWKNMTMPSWFWGEGRENHDGIFWLRKTFLGNEKIVGQDFELDLGYFSDAIKVWVNGQLLDGSNLADEGKRRKYIIQSKWIRIGKNTIVVKVFDKGAASGNWNVNNILSLNSSCSSITLSGQWKVKLTNFQYLPQEQFDTAPMCLYNAMIAPLHKFPIKGVLWYQGESNAWPQPGVEAYRFQLASMIADWRLAWKSPNMPFLIVQLPVCGDLWENPNRWSNWALMRESQAKAVELADDNSGLAITLDVGEPKDVHPKDKQTVGYRLALLARKKVYNEDIVGESPSYESIEIEGKNVRIHFKNIGGGLIAKDKFSYLKGFVLAGEDKVWYWAKATIEGDKVVVSSDKVTRPVAVRYAWGQSPIDANLFNKEGLPVGTFRSDNWEMIFK